MNLETRRSSLVQITTSLFWLITEIIFVCGHRLKTKELLVLLLLFLILFLFTFWLIPHLNEMKNFWLTWQLNL